jgi:hypothetical protein
MIRAIGIGIGVFVAVVAAVLWVASLTQRKPAELSDYVAKRQAHGEPVLQRGRITWMRLDPTSDVISGNIRNITRRPLRNVIARIVLENQNARTIAWEVAQMDRKVVLPGQVASYRAVMKHDDAARMCLVDFIDGETRTFLIDRR